MQAEDFSYTAGFKFINVNNQNVEVYCDEEGFTMIHARFYDSSPYEHVWNEYVAGFGAPGQNYWLGLDNIHFMTQQKPYTLKINARTNDGFEAEATRANFALGPSSVSN